LSDKSTVSMAVTSVIFLSTAAAGIVSFLAYFKARGKTSVVAYHAKFSGMALVIALLSSVTWPLMLLGRLGRRSPTYVPYNLTPFLLYGRHVMGVKHVCTQSVEVLKERLYHVGPSVVVINHQSCLDAFGVVQLWRQIGRLRIVAKKSFQYFGPVGIVGNLADFVFIDRSKGNNAVDQMVNAVERSKESEGAPLLVFPEGTRHHDPKSRTLLPFKKGAFIAAVRAKVPVVPVVFSPYSNLNHEEKTIQPAVIKVSVLEPIRPKPEITDENEHVNILVSETRSRMLKEFQSS